MTKGSLPGKAARARRRLAVARKKSGVRGLAAEGLHLVRRATVIPVTAAVDMLFDRRMGVRTRGETRREADLTPMSVGGDPNFYQPIYLLPWKRCMATIPVDRRATTFIDLGAGRGRAVILAAESGFRKVIGVELDPELAEEAQRNVIQWQKRRAGRQRTTPQISIVEGDAATFRMPEGPLVILLYNPFGETTMRHVLTHLCAERSGSADAVYVAYFNPVHEFVFGEFPPLVPHSNGRGWSVLRLAPASGGG